MSDKVCLRIEMMTKRKFRAGSDRLRLHTSRSILTSDCSRLFWSCPPNYPPTLNVYSSLTYVGYSPYHPGKWLVTLALYFIQHWFGWTVTMTLMAIFFLWIGLLERVGWSLDDELGSDRSRWIQDLINQGLWFPSKSTTGWDGIHIWRGGSMNGIHLSRDVLILLSGLQ